MQSPRPRLVIAERQSQSGLGHAVLDADAMTLALFGDDLEIKISRDSQWLVFAHDEHRGQRTAIFDLGASCEGCAQGIFGCAVESERGQDGAIGFGLGEMPASEDVPEILLDSVPLGGITECVVEGHITNVAWRGGTLEIKFFYQAVQLRLE